MQNYIERQWALCLDDFSKTISSAGMDLWINTLQPINVENDKIVFVAPSDVCRQQIYNNYLSRMKEVLKEHFKLENALVLIPEEQEAYIEAYNKSHASETGAVLDTKPTTLQNPFNPRYTFDNFVVGTTNQVIYAAARAVAESPAVRFNPLFIYGGSGLGKTHLLHAIGNYIWQHKMSNLNIVYVTCEQFTNDFVEALRVRQERGMEAFYKQYRQADVLLIDDIQFISSKKGVQEEFFNTFNELYQKGKQIIISSDRPPKDIPTLEERLRSRFASGFMQDIQPPDFETRLLIIQKKIEIERYEFEKGIDYELAERLSNFNIREMEAILRKIYFLANLNGKAVATFADMNEVLEKECQQCYVSDEKLTHEKIINAVCKYFTIDQKELTGRKRNKEIVEPRQICIYLMWHQLAIPLATIGEIFGRDHTTIIHARDKIMEQIKTNKQIKKVISDITSLLKTSND
ncbi:MAG: chromosomal replication initiator protein DnaA [Clostridia bacterium]|nr:chromosomal replication initiator protein DnaA [Clostridia bacterium]